MKIDDFIEYEQPTNYIVHSDQYVENGNTPVLTAGQSFILGYTNEEDGIYTDFPAIIFDDFTTSVQYVDFSFKVKSSAMKILKNKANANLKYCYYLLSWLQKMPPNHKRQWISTTSQINICLPSLNEQSRIVEKIETVSNIIQMHKQELQNLDELVKARFVEMFSSVENNVLGLETIKIKNAFDLINGKAFKPEDWSDEGLPIVRIQNLNNEQAPFNYYAGEIKAQYLIDTGELLFSWSGTPGTSFGAFFWNRGKAVLNQHIFRVKPKIEVNLSFLQFALNGRIDYIISKAHGGVGLQHITKKELDEVELLLPAIDLQNQFAVFVEQIDKSKFVKKIEQSEVLL